MSAEGQSSGWGTAVLLVGLALVIGYFFLYSAPVRELSDLNSEIAATNEEISARSQVKVQADPTTAAISSQAVDTTRGDLFQLARSVGIPGSALQSIDRGIRIEARGSPQQVGEWISALTGRTYFDGQGQIRGLDTVARARLKVRTEGPALILEARLTSP